MAKSLNDIKNVNEKFTHSNQKHNNMKPVQKNTTKVPSKGTRKKWEPLSGLKPVKLTAQMTIGRLLLRSASNGHFLVP